MNPTHQKLCEQEMEKPILEGLAVLAKIIAGEIEKKWLISRAGLDMNKNVEKLTNE